MSSPQIKPRYNLLRLDETQFWAEQVVRRAKQIFGLYVFDKNKGVHCCEFTPSYECLFIGSQVGNLDLGDAEGERLSEDIRNGDAANEFVRYFHCHEIDAKPTIREHELKVGVSDLDIQDEDEALEYVRQRVL